MLQAILVSALGRQDDSLEKVIALVRETARVERVAMIVELPMWDVDVTPPKQPHGLWSMVQVASATNTQWQTIDGIQVFARRSADATSLRVQSRLLLLRALANLNDDDLLAAMKGGINFNKLTAADRAEILTWAGTWPGVAGSTTLDHPQETLDAFRSAADSTRMTLDPVRKYIVTTKSGKRIEVTDDQSMMEMMSHDGANEIPPTKPDPQLLDLTPTDGELDFKSGEVMIVRALLNRADIAFGENYVVDGRVSTLKVFVCGKFTQERFESCMKRFLDYEPFHIVADSADADDLTKKLMDRVSSLVPGSFGGLGEKLTIDELGQRSTNGIRSLNSQGIDLDGATVTVSYGFMLGIDPGVELRIGTDHGTLDGKAFDIPVHRKLGISLGF